MLYYTEFKLNWKPMLIKTTHTYLVQADSVPHNRPRLRK